MGPSLTVRTINDDQQSSSGEWFFVGDGCHTLAGSRNQQYIVGGNVLHVQEPTRDTRHADAAPAAVENAVNAAGGASAVAEPTNIEAGPPSTADAGNAAGASSAVAESAPAAPVLKDANSAAIVAPAIAGTALATTAKRKAVGGPTAKVSYLKETDADQIVASIETERMYFHTESREGELRLPAPYETNGVAPGFYIIVAKGCLRHRLAIIGVMTARQEGLTMAQKYLRMIAYVQQMHMSDAVAWRTVRTEKEEQSWGPERPSFANGALCYLNARDAKAVETKVAEGNITLMSKHIVISAEYVPILCEVYNTVIAMKNTPSVMDGMTGRALYTFGRSPILCDFDWYGTDTHGPRRMKRRHARRKVEWASAIDRFEDGSFVAEDTCPGKPILKNVKGGGLPSAMLVNPYNREAGDEPKLTEEALADVGRMAKHAAVAIFQEQADRKLYTKPLYGLWTRTQ